MSEDNGKIRVTMTSKRLTGEQSERVMRIAREKHCEYYEYWDNELADLGLVTIGEIPDALKSKLTREIDASWRNIRRIVRGPATTAQVKAVEYAANRLHHVAYRMDKKYVTLTKAGHELADKGRTVTQRKEKL